MNTQLQQIAAALLFAALALLALAFLRKPRTRPLPPSPPAWPLIGHLHLLGTFPHQDLLRQASRYGPIMYLRLGSVGTVVASSAAVAREFLKTHERAFASRPSGLATKLLSYDGRNLSFSPYGARWRDLRKLSVLQLFSPTRLESLRPIREDAIESTLRGILQDSEEGKFGEVGAIMSTMAANIMAMMTFSAKYGTNDVTEYRALLIEASTLIGGFFIGDYVPCLRWLDLQGYERSMRSVHKKLDAFSNRTVEEHRKKRKEDAGLTTTQDFLDVLLQNQSSNQEHLDDVTIKAVMNDVIAAGTDTSAVTLEWAMAELIQNPGILDKARAEIDAAVGRERRVRESDIAELKFLRAVVKETLRLHTTAPLLVPRESTEACEVLGYHIPAGTRLLVNAWAMARDPGVWEAAEEFDPGRFMPEDVDVGVGGLDVQGLIPFGAGRRSCPAYALALCMVHTTLATLIQCFDWELPAADQREHLDMSEAFALVLRKARPLQLRFIPRLPKHLITTTN